MARTRFTSKLIFIVLCFVCGKLRTTEAAVPVLSDILVPINLPEGTVTETLLDTFTVTDPDGLTITSCSHTGDSGEFDIRQDTSDPTVFRLYVVSGAGLEYDNNPSYTLTVTCEDGAAEQGTDTITIDIIPNQHPTITAPTGAVNVGENDVTQTVIYTLTVSDAETNNIVCDLQDVTPTTSAFGMWKATTDYQVYLLDNPNLQYSAASSYTATLRCSDPFGYSTMSLTIDVIPNVGPTFDNLPTTDQSFDASTTTATTSLFTVTTTDTDSPTVTYTIDVSPDTAVFTIDHGTGEITAAVDLIYALNTTYDITISANDGKTTTTENLRILLTNVNTAPTISNLPTTEDISELQTPGVIFTLTVADPDSGETISFPSWSVAPSSDTEKFSFNETTYELSLAAGKSFDYETQGSYVLQFYVSDQKAQTGPHILTIRITDRNEPCSFSDTVYYATTHEADVGAGAVDFGAVISDQDNGDTFTLTIQTSANGYSNYFNIEATSPILTFAVNYDVDQNAYPANVPLVIQCTDAGGETGTATVSVTINDINDNAPDFGSSGYIVYVNQYSSLGTSIGRISAPDRDSGDNGQVTYSWVPLDSTPGSPYYQLSAQGTISLISDISGFNFGQSHRFLATAEDHGNPVLSGTTTVDVIYVNVTTTTTTVSTTTANNSISFFDEPGNVAFVVCLIVFTLLLLGLLAYLFYRYCKCKQRCRSCRKTKKPKLEKVKPLPKKPDTKREPFDFWNKANDRYHSNTIRPSLTPTPVK